MKQVAAAGGLVVALAGIVGGVAFAQASQRVEAPMVVVPAGQAITGTPTVSPSAVPVMVAPKPAATSKPAAVKRVAAPVVKAAPAPVRLVAPVSSKKATVKKASATTTRSLAVASDPTPAQPAPRETGTVVTNDDGSTTIQMQPGQLPPVIPAKPAPEPSPAG